MEAVSEEVFKEAQKVMGAPPPGAEKLEPGDKVRVKIGGQYQDMTVNLPDHDLGVQCYYFAADARGRKPQRFIHYANPRHITKK